MVELKLNSENINTPILSEEEELINDESLVIEKIKNYERIYDCSFFLLLPSLIILSIIAFCLYFENIYVFTIYMVITGIYILKLISNLIIYNKKIKKMLKYREYEF